MTAAGRLNLIALPPFAIAAALLGALAAMKPDLAVAAVGVGALVAASFLFPVAHLIALVGILAIVPFSLQNAYGAGGGTGAAGLVATDIMLMAGLARAAVALAQTRTPARLALAAAAAVAFLGVAVLQFAHGVLAGADLSDAGTEVRPLLGFGTVLVAAPILIDSDARGRLLRGLTALGLAVGIWGLAQWTLSISYGETGDIGVRAGVAETTAGRGQLLGGLYTYPVAVIVGFSALLSGIAAAGRARLLLAAMVVVNLVCVLLTYERTFWVVTVAGCLFVALRAGRIQRLRAIAWFPLVALAVAVPLAAISPGTLTSAGERLVSLGQYGSDPSIDYRVRESSFVLDEIEERPLVGSGLGATIFWGRPASQIPPSEFTFSHNGYLRVAWKLGLPAAILLFGGLLLVALSRARPDLDPGLRAIIVGCQAAVLALVIANVTFPSITALSSTATAGVLVAMCALAGGTTRRKRP